MARGANVSPAAPSGSGSGGIAGISAAVHRGFDAVDELFGIDSRKPYEGVDAAGNPARGNAPAATPIAPAAPVAPASRQIAGEVALYVIVPFSSSDGRPAWAVTNGPCSDVAMCTSEALARRVRDLLNIERGAVRS
jgi:hypothetical protein